MTLGTVLEIKARNDAVPATDRSRCSRLRFSENTCVRCAEQCPHNAVEIEDDVRIREDRCTHCGLCAAACPSDAIVAKGTGFFSLAGDLLRASRSVSSPVLGCAARAGVDCHAKSACFGFLSEAHLLFLFTILRGPLQIDMTGCRECANGFIASVIEKRIAEADAAGLPVSAKVRLITDRSALDFREIAYGRRGFFSALKTLTFTQAAGLLRDGEPAGRAEAYTAKKLPGKRELLNRLVTDFPEDKARAVLDRYYFTLRADEACNNCFACVGMCPSGALTIAEGADGRELRFISALCSGCGLCESFCLTGALVMARGFAGCDPGIAERVAGKTS